MGNITLQDSEKFSPKIKTASTSGAKHIDGVVAEVKELEKIAQSLKERQDSMQNFMLGVVIAVIIAFFVVIYTWIVDIREFEARINEIVLSQEDKNKFDQMRQERELDALSSFHDCLKYKGFYSVNCL